MFELVLGSIIGGKNSLRYKLIIKSSYLFEIHVQSQHSDLVVFGDLRRMPKRFILKRFVALKLSNPEWSGRKIFFERQTIFIRALSLSGFVLDNSSHKSRET